MRYRFTGKLTGSGKNIDMDNNKLKINIENASTVEKLWKIGEKIFGKSDDAVCAVTYLIERAYILGKQDNAARRVSGTNHPPSSYDHGTTTKKEKK